MPVARILPIALRLGAVVATAVATVKLGRALAAHSHAGRIDQRAEDALDDLPDGLALARAKTMGDAEENRQTNAAARLRRTIRLGGKRLEIDAAGLARLRIKRI